MEDQNKKIRIAAVGDVHVRESDKGKWIEYFKRVSQEADVLLICGDLTDTGDEGEAQVLAEELKACSIPVVGVLGNHDYEKGRHKLIRQILQNNNMSVLDGEALVIHGIGFAGVKGFGGGFDGHMLSMFGEGAMKAFVQEAVDEALHLDRALARLDQEHENIKKVAILHYAPIKDTVIGEPEQIFPFLGSSRLAEPLSRRNVVAAFHGHAHVGQLEGATSSGVKVYNVAKQILMKAGYEFPFYIFEV
ncbi:Icc-related predicted phosphoesterase [Arcticibacter tournemirensis]|uniref:Metallophosphoesterase n=1 Tax=Arcticibacter tournemirensis TaxID=699437 RepID=A0A5M9H454_9SPHI|nr:metallophosphoesterase [Arcticibacter tournemirensis]KAA8479944.1 metallophosphoesterase [Arcticibacter tournemirensis]TQM51596.1 Icc-related predicted phosphoesterase [Arcticibacter tournemirensis]